MSFSPLDIPNTSSKPFTDYSRWRLVVDEDGRHSWTYLRTDEECAEWPQKPLDKFWMGLPTDLPDLPPAKTPLESARNGYEYYKHLQAHDGHWPGEYGGPMFLIPGLTIGSYITGVPFTNEERLEMIRYLMNHANEDGGWGIHIEGPSTAFGTSLNYCAIRILGMSADHPVAVKARGCLHGLGSALAAPAWGKFWLSVLGVYEWEGNNPVPPELWLLPEWLPFHPHRWWIHCRMVYLPMSYLYGSRFKPKETDLILSLREELYTQDYDSIEWEGQGNNVCKVDLYAPHSALFDGLNVILTQYEKCSLPPLRRAALKRVYELILTEDDNTDFQDLGPVNKMMNFIVRWLVDGPESVAFKKHRRRRADFMWLAGEGMMMTGTNGSQLWDIAFISQAIVETGLGAEDSNRASCIKALEWLDQAQIKGNTMHFGSDYRHQSKGAWPFSTPAQSYTVSDCTAEGLKAVLYLQEHLDFTPKLISAQRMYDAVDVMLSLQNSDGGFASYEIIRGPQWLEMLNPAEVFGRIMIEHNYPECTTSVLTALAIFRKHYSKYRAADIEKCLQKAIGYLHRAQQPGGGWVGSWGICFTYAAQFALESLSLVGETYETSDYSRKGCEFLLKHQRQDGGWGESWESCATLEWVEQGDAQVVQTAWAVMGLMYAKYPHAEPIERAVRLVMSRQLPDGSWAQEAIEGMFNRTVAISYPNFKFSFTIWMLGKADAYLRQLKAKGRN
ncbi:lanosterol synthase [Thelephora terrestris]|uniref:Terpene cyclase/mutase family member n=1 Tax=Thelephora terrestris TaxID=56493 RepID=A0A9P6L783_9AGAM|nr:lanosterol synthase [Thelephora terrestris]